MTIEITQPELEALIWRRIQSGDFATPEEVIFHALRSSKPTQPAGEALVEASKTPNGDIEIAPASSGSVVERMRALRARVKPDPEGWTTRDYVEYGRR